MQIVRTPRELQAVCEKARAEGARVGFVPTMGALHEGHLSLVRACREAGSTYQVVSIFVNPTQFGAGEDLDKYPRTFEADREACERESVDLIFAPEPQAMYPEGSTTFVEVEGLTEVLEGTYRPTHFRGVTTIVAKLLAAVGPCVAAFGRKDYQQLKVLERMVEDLFLPVQMLGAPIKRDPDGLAMSSRNRYLSESERARALSIVAGLREAFDAFTAGERDPSALTRLVHTSVERSFDRIDYVRAVRPHDLVEVDSPVERLTLLVAAHVGRTRLIDNLELGHDARP